MRDLFSYLLLTLFCIGMVVNVAAQKKQKIKPEVREYVDRKVREYIDRKHEECLERARREAERRVDSLLKNIARERSLDTFPRPQKPLRPNRPEIHFPRDTRPIRPLPDTPVGYKRDN